MWVDYFNGTSTSETNALDALLGNELLAVGDLILTEVLQGFRHDRDYDIAKDLLTSLSIFDLLGKDLAIKSANNFRALRKKGITVRKTADVIIATFCVEHDFPLLHSDRDFDPLHTHLNLRHALH